MQPGDLLEQFVIEKILGSGGMGEVYLAEDRKLGRKVAIKTIRKQKVKSVRATEVERFLQEAKLLASLNHQNIVSIFDIKQQDDTHFIIMEHVEGRPLNQIIKSRGFGIGEAFRVLNQILSGLGFIHHRGIIHRDIKAQNIMISIDAMAKILDFGIAKTFNRTENLTRAGGFLGTTSYLAPEMLKNGSASVQSDIFALGCLFFYMLTGEHPFEAEDEYSTLKNIELKPVEFPKNLKSIIPDSLQKICLKMLEKDPVSRYQSVNEIMVEIDAVPREDLENEISRIRRPDAILVNEEELRLMLLGQGFQTREIALILSLAASLEEKDRLTEQTIPLGGEPERRVSIGTLQKALSRWQQAKSKLYTDKKAGASRRSWTSAKAGLAALVATIFIAALFVGIYKFNEDTILFSPEIEQLLEESRSNPVSEFIDGQGKKLGILQLGSGATGRFLLHFSGFNSPWNEKVIPHEYYKLHSRRWGYNLTNLDGSPRPQTYQTVVSSGQVRTIKDSSFDLVQVWVKDSVQNPHQLYRNPLGPSSSAHEIIKAFRRSSSGNQ